MEPIMYCIAQLVNGVNVELNECFTKLLSCLSWEENAHAVLRCNEFRQEVCSSAKNRKKTLTAHSNWWWTCANKFLEYARYRKFEWVFRSNKQRTSLSCVKLGRFLLLSKLTTTSSVASQPTLLLKSNKLSEKNELEHYQMSTEKYAHV